MRIRIDDLEFPNENEGDDSAYLNGELFSGVAIEELNNNCFITNYLNGQLHGRLFGYDMNTNKILLDENYLKGFKHGKCYEKNYKKDFESYEYYNEGMVQSLKFFSFNGVLLKEFDKEKKIDIEYYDDGTIYKEKVCRPDRDESFVNYFLGNRDLWLCCILKYDERKKISYTKFNNNLIINEVHSLNSKFHWPLIGWFITDIMKDDREKAYDFLLSLIEHQDDYLKREAAHFLGELGEAKAIYHLEKELRNPNIPPLLHKRFDYGMSGTFLSIGETASMAIKKLNKEL